MQQNTQAEETLFRDGVEALGQGRAADARGRFERLTAGGPARAAVAAARLFLARGQ